MTLPPTWSQELRLLLLSPKHALAPADDIAKRAGRHEEECQDAGDVHPGAVVVFILESLLRRLRCQYLFLFLRAAGGAGSVRVRSGRGGSCLALPQGSCFGHCREARKRKG